MGYRASNTAKSAQIHAVNYKDLGDLNSFLTGWPGDDTPANTWQARFDHWWDSNPYFQPTGVRGYMIKAENRVVGFFGLIPMAFQLLGQERLVFAASTWRVLPEFRRFSLELASLVRQAGRETLLFTWSANETVGQAHVRYGFAPISRPRAFTQAVPSALLVQFSSASSKSLRIASPLVYAHSHVAWGRMSFAGRKLESHRLPNATGEIDRFWNDTKAKVANTHVRTSQFLNWYCVMDAVFQKRLYGCYRNGTLCGLLMMGEKTPPGLKLLECLDLWLDWTIPGVFDSLFAAVIRDIRKEGINGIELPPFTPEIMKCAKTRWFLPHHVKRYPEFVFGPKEQVESMLSGDTALYGTVGDYYL